MCTAHRMVYIVYTVHTHSHTKTHYITLQNKHSIEQHTYTLLVCKHTFHTSHKASAVANLNLKLFVHCLSLFVV